MGQHLGLFADRVTRCERLKASHNSLCVFQGLVRQGQLFYSDSMVGPRKAATLTQDIQLPLRRQLLPNRVTSELPMIRPKSFGIARGYLLPTQLLCNLRSGTSSGLREL
jgi:hypothetical protein